MRTIPVHQSLLRHDLVMGGERELVLCSAVLYGLVAFGGMNLPSAAVSLVCWLGTMPILQRMAKSDPMMSRVWLRQLRQQNFYPAHSTPWCRSKEKQK